MDIQIIINCIKTPDLGRDPRLDVPEEVHPVVDRSSDVILGKRITGGRTKRAKDVALATAAIIDLLPGSLSRARRVGSRFRANQLLTGIAFRRHQPHLIQANHRAVFRRGGVERFNDPLFLANSGSRRSPNHVSWERQRSPSAISSSSIRLRLIGIFFSSLRYVSSRSSVQHAKGWPSCCGSVSAAAMTSETCS